MRSSGRRSWGASMSQTNLGQFPGTKDGSVRIERDAVKRCPKCRKWAFKSLNIGRSRWKCGKCGFILFSRTYKNVKKEHIPIGVADEALVAEERKRKERSLEIQKMRMER